MYDSLKKIEALNRVTYNSTFVSKEIDVHFFDNDITNFEDHSNIEGFPKFYNLVTHKVVDERDIQVSTKMSHDFFFHMFEIARLPSEDDDLLVMHFVRMKDHFLSHFGNDFLYYFDGYSGFDFESFSMVEEKSIYVFDWDRTITLCEGFLQCLDTAHEYVKWLDESMKQYDVFYGCDDDDIDTKVRLHLALLCGGTERFHAIQNCLTKIQSEKLFILTNNRCENLIFSFAMFLNPNIQRTNVISMQYDQNIQGFGKIAYIKQKIMFVQ